MASQNMEIHLKDGLCKIIQGDEKRVFYSTENAVGLALLRLKPNDHRATISWVDFLIARGLAVGYVGDRMFTLMLIPPRSRNIVWTRGNIKKTLAVNTPELLMATRFDTGHLVKAMVLVVKSGSTKVISVVSQEKCLAAFPFGNVYNHGTVCWGNTPIQDLKHPSEVEDAFFNSGFNGDLFYPAQFGSQAQTLPDVVRTAGADLKPLIATAYTRSVSVVAQEISG